MINLDLLLDVMNASKETQNMINCILNDEEYYDAGMDWDYFEDPNVWYEEREEQRIELEFEALERSMTPAKYADAYTQDRDYRRFCTRFARGTTHDHSRQRSTMTWQNKRRNARAVKAMIVFGEGIAYEQKH